MQAAMFGCMTVLLLPTLLEEHRHHLNSSTSAFSTSGGQLPCFYLQLDYFMSYLDLTGRSTHKAPSLRKTAAAIERTGCTQAAVDYIQRRDRKADQNKEYRVAMAFQNVTCLQFALWLPNESPRQVQYYSLSVIPLSAYMPSLLSSDAYPNTSDLQSPSLGDIPEGFTDKQELRTGIIAGCTGVECNASAGTWMRVTSLKPQERYLLIQAPASLQAAGSDQQKVYAIMQAFSAGESQSSQSSIWHSRHVPFQICVHMHLPSATKWISRAVVLDCYPGTTIAWSMDLQT